MKLTSKGIEGYLHVIELIPSHIDLLVKIEFSKTLQDF